MRKIIQSSVPGLADALKASHGTIPGRSSGSQGRTRDRKEETEDQNSGARILDFPRRNYNLRAVSLGFRQLLETLSGEEGRDTSGEYLGPREEGYEDTSPPSFGGSPST